MSLQAFRDGGLPNIQAPDPVICSLFCAQPLAVIKAVKIHEYYYKGTDIEPGGST